ncbi:MAG: hypothetical protein V9G12_17650 [Microthrixaceae bacterium]
MRAEYRGNAIGTRDVVAAVRTPSWERIGPLATAVHTERGAAGRHNSRWSLQTVFSPLTTARELSTEPVSPTCAASPKRCTGRCAWDVPPTIRLCAQSGRTASFLRRSSRRGGCFQPTSARRFGQDYDLEILRALEGRSRLNMLHAHGDDIDVDVLAEYPVEMLNWHDRLTPPPIAAATTRFPRLLVGGLNEHGTLLSAGPTKFAPRSPTRSVNPGGEGL